MEPERRKMTKNAYKWVYPIRKAQIYSWAEFSFIYFALQRVCCSYACRSMYASIGMCYTRVV